MRMETKEIFERGKKHFEGRNYARAEQYFTKLLRSGTKYADVHNMLGVIFHREGKFNNAIESFEEALKINPNYTEAILNLAVLYNDLGEYKKSRSLYTQAKKRKSSSHFDPIVRGKIANMHAQLGEAYRNAGKYPEAIEEYKKAVELCPNFADIRTKLGICYRDNKQNSQAIKEFESTLKENPSYTAAQLQLGVTYYSSGQKQKAQQAWNAVLKRDPTHEIAQMYLRLVDGSK